MTAYLFKSTILSGYNTSVNIETFFYICTYKATGSADLKPCSLKPSTLQNIYAIHWYTICFEPAQILTKYRYTLNTLFTLTHYWLHTTMVMMICRGWQYIHASTECSLCFESMCPHLTAVDHAQKWNILRSQSLDKFPNIRKQDSGKFKN